MCHENNSVSLVARAKCHVVFDDVLARAGVPTSEDTWSPLLKLGNHFHYIPNIFCTDKGSDGIFVLSFILFFI